MALFALATAALAIGGDLSPAESVALIVVAVRYLDRSRFSPNSARVWDHPPDAERIGSVLNAETDGPQEGFRQPRPISGRPSDRVREMSPSATATSADLANLNLTIESGSATAIIRCLRVRQVDDPRADRRPAPEPQSGRILLTVST